jgi:hypothetical protein
MRDATGSDLTGANLLDAERATVERDTRVLETAARLLLPARIANEQASIRADIERLVRPPW